MKHIKTYIFILLLVALLWPSTAFAKDLFDDKVVFGGTFTLEAGETHDGSLVVFGGAVTVEPDTTVNGDVVLIGGTVEIGGDVNGNVVGIGGAVRLSKSAVINGDLFTMGATLRREDGAKVNGQVVNGTEIPFSFNVPNNSNGSDFTLPETPQVPSVSVDANPVLSIMWFFFRTFMIAALAVLLVMFLPAHVNRVSNAALSQPVITAGAGLLTAILAPLALIAITITIILIPVTLVAIILLFVAWLLGWVALGLEAGRRIARAVNMEWAPAISAGVGTFIILFVLGGISKAIPCIGWIPQTLVGLWGLGAVLMTRFGTQEYATNNQTAVVDAPGSGDASLPEVVVTGDEVNSGNDVVPGEDTSVDQEDPKS
jgi:hypothetical protein